MTFLHINNNKNIIVFPDNFIITTQRIKLQPGVKIKKWFYLTTVGVESYAYSGCDYIKNQFGTVLTWKSLQNELLLERSPNKLRAAMGLQKTKEIQDWIRMRYADEIVLVPEWAPFTWFRDKTSHWNENFDPEREPVANSIRNDFTFVPESCQHYALKCSYKRGDEETGGRSFRIETRSRIM